MFFFSFLLLKAKGINNGIGFTPERQKPPSDSAGCVNISVLTVILTIVTTLLV